MTKKKKAQSEKVKSGEQLSLMDVGPKNLKKIAPIARRYRDNVRERLAIQALEKADKEAIKKLVHAAGLTRLPNGHITFTCDGLLIDLEPKDEVVHVKDAKE